MPSRDKMPTKRSSIYAHVMKKQKRRKKICCLFFFFLFFLFFHFFFFCIFFCAFVGEVLSFAKFVVATPFSLPSPDTCLNCKDLRNRAVRKVV